MGSIRRPRRRRAERHPECMAQRGCMEIEMKASLVVAGIVLALSAPLPAFAADAPFRCDARAGSICYFRLFYEPRGGRVVTMPAGTASKIPGLAIGKDSYCVGLNKSPDNR